VSRFLKVEGAGNDFLLSVDPAMATRLGTDAARVRWLCDRRRGVGADGVIVIITRGTDRISLHYWNADGSPAAFCANGTRCAAAVARFVCGLSESLVVETGWGAVPAVVSTSGSVLLRLPYVSVESTVSLSDGTRSLVAHTVAVGVPHAVVPVASEAELVALVPAAPALRWDRAFGDQGCNVHLITGTDDAIQVRSFERGLDDEPLSCGSGVVAAAAVWLAEHKGPVVHARTRGDDVLVVRRRPDGLELEGPTSIVAWVEPFEEARPRR
jgi:diaminopimelate epimerase